MTPEALQLIGQLGLSGLLFYLLLDERKAHIADVVALRAENQVAEKRYFDFMERLIIRSLKLHPVEISEHEGD